MVQAPPTGSHNGNSSAGSSRTAVVIPSLGGPHLQSCLRGIAGLDPAPSSVLVVLSGGARPPQQLFGCAVRTTPIRLGFTGAVNTGIREVLHDADHVAVLNDDAVPHPGWLAGLVAHLDRHHDAASVQGTVLANDGSAIDGRGITFDAFGLPVQRDRGRPFADDEGRRPVVAVSATACLYRAEALRQVDLGGGTIFDESFGSYHEDLDLGLRLRRLGWTAMWIGGSPVDHVGSASGRGFSWRHPWWVLANRWRALAGNLTAGSLVRRLPRLLRGEARAVGTLVRRNPRAAVAAAAVLACLPALILRGWRRPTPGDRLTDIPEEAW